ncbi:MAG: hypothetical protein A2Y34_12500 [Spirochaetes bacterium GWC1_27_15]|nr:MAG: hypothetical protein A2Z98_08480 [Spirochaetes bacterium GWB1_27_13]OHD21836.1 MAG: hypothetical protein A2Y34_12500 [Spirochaetes bacterium GWC1_27_15]
MIKKLFFLFSFFLIIFACSEPNNTNNDTKIEPKIDPFTEVTTITWDFEYIGSFNVPNDSGFGYSATGVAFNPSGDNGKGSIFIVGHDWYQKIAEITIPVPQINSDVTKLPSAQFLQPFTDEIFKRSKYIRQDGSILDENIKIGGLLVYDNKLYGNSYAFYSGANEAKRSHFRTGLNLSSISIAADFKGMFTVGNMNPGMTGGYMTIIPESKREYFGGFFAFTGQMGLSIISRSSYGPSLHTLSLSDFDNTVDSIVSSMPLIYYTYDYQTLGEWGNVTIPNPVFNMMSRIYGAVYPDNSQYIYLIGRTGIGVPYYGQGTDNPNDAGYDPVDKSKGCHAWPYVNYIWVYDEVDLKAVFNGTKKPWEIKPSSHGLIKLPYYDKYKTCDLCGVSYDAQNKKLYVVSRNMNVSKPLVHVFEWKK